MNQLLPKEPYLLMLDFDGTLVPIAERPDAILVSKELLYLLERLYHSPHKVYIVSGRSVKDLQRFLPQVRLPLIGMHGLETPWGGEPKAHTILTKVKEALIPLTRRYPGLLIENKGLGVAVHVRQVPLPEQGHALIAAEQLLKYFVEKSHKIKAEEPLNLLYGHSLIEVRPSGASKGAAVKQLVEKHPDYFPLYIGDDITDEEAFAQLPSHSLSIRVGAENTPTHAKYLLSSPKEVISFLEQLL